MNKNISFETPIPGIFQEDWKNVFNHFNRTNPTYRDTEKVDRLCKLYIKFGKVFGIRADIAWAQMCHETSYLEFNRGAQAEWNNFAGIGVSGKEGVGNKFESEELGVIAHYAHLAWYVFPNHVNEYCNRIYDPRHFGKHKFNGNYKLSRLQDSWSLDKNYVNNIIEISSKMPNSNKPQIEKFDLIIQMGHIGRIKKWTGTKGEQAFTRALGVALYDRFKGSDYRVRLMGADNFLLPEPNQTKLFLSIHADGHWNNNIRGVSVGYPVPSNPAFAQYIKEAYMELTGFQAKPDNYTNNLERYYSWRWDDRETPHISADYYCLFEHGFMTNPIERDYMNNHTGEIADCHHKTIINFLKRI
jgi:hypothetical protein